MNPAILPPAFLSFRYLPTRSEFSLRTPHTLRMRALREEVVLPSTRIAKMGNLLHSTVQ
ncbi:hypothetical protein EJ02DRAFT_55167 [Clathrospora elynae]|uniref:Uncharacterized protein n=1 Tax=Clathrospora elynae TaxID=706981 RepID=A0A6A5SG89_9PLEO|nr:hypothetical protein EJ02DRAFT_55167 [Clathrospora elynae]